MLSHSELLEAIREFALLYLEIEAAPRAGLDADPLYPGPGWCWQVRSALGYPATSRHTGTPIPQVPRPPPGFPTNVVDQDSPGSGCASARVTLTTL